MGEKNLFELWNDKELPEEIQKETDSFAEARNGTEEEKIFRAGFHIAWNKSRYEKLLGLED